MQFSFLAACSAALVPPWLVHELAGDFKRRLLTRWTECLNSPTSLKALPATLFGGFPPADLSVWTRRFFRRLYLGGLCLAWQRVWTRRCWSKTLGDFLQRGISSQTDGTNPPSLFSCLFWLVLHCFRSPGPKCPWGTCFTWKDSFIILNT